MKWIMGILAATWIFTACDNELVVTDEWKDIPVVWALVNKSDTAHYIRVEKAYLDPTTSAEDIARIPDSLYYDDAVVTLKRISTGQVFTLTRVDGNLEGYPRDTGTFAEVPNYLYKIKANQINLVIGDEYEFSLVRSDIPEPVLGKTIILPPPVLRNPSVGNLLSFRQNTTFTFRWDEIEDAGLYDLKMRFHFLEKNDTTAGQFIPRVIEWTLARNLTDREHRIDGAEFYNALKSRIKQDPFAERIFQGVDIVVWCGGQELAEFVKITQANTGITSTQEIPGYTNLTPTGEAIGIFTSRNLSENTGFQLTNQSLDSLRNGSITGNLNFQ